MTNCKSTLRWINSIIAIMFISLTTANAQHYAWAKAMGGLPSESYGKSIAVDASGNVYTTGYFSNTVDFDPGVGVANLTSVGNQSLFISKLDANGNYVWAKVMGGLGYARGNEIALDASGNIHLIGGFQGTVDFDPGIGVANLTSNGYENIFISKLDANGNFIWAKTLAAMGNVYSNIALDDNGNVYTIGQFWGTVNFDPGGGIANLTSNGNADIFISKLDMNGNYMWAKALGGAGNDAGIGIATDANGNLYTIGHFMNTIDFDPGAGIAYLTSIGGEDIFISKLDVNGNFVWAKVMGGVGVDGGSRIAIDVFGNVFSAGYFTDTVDFDPGAGVVNLMKSGNTGIFISKLDANGNYLWAKSFEGDSNSYVSGIVLDVSGNVFTSGGFFGTLDFDPGLGMASLTSNGGLDNFISKLDSYGNYIWAKTIGGISQDVAGGIAIDANGNVYTTGGFLETVDFDPGLGSANLTSIGPATTIYISKLGISPLSITPLEKNADHRITLYPNPTTTSITVSLDQMQQGRVTIKLINVNGSIIQKIDSNVTPGLMKLQLDLSALSEGNYVVEIRNNETLLQTSKITKIN